MTHIISQEETISDTSMDKVSSSISSTRDEIPIIDKGENSILICDVCESCNIERCFQNKEALFQHMRAKHTKAIEQEIIILAQSNLGDVARTMGTASTTNNVDTSVGIDGTMLPNIYEDYNHSYTCPACDSVFSSREAVQGHLDCGISPPEVVKSQCDNCLRFFQNERGLVQHILSCKVSKLSDI